MGKGNSYARDFGPGVVLVRTENSRLQRLDLDTIPAVVLCCEPSGAMKLPCGHECRAMVLLSGAEDVLAKDVEFQGEFRAGSVGVYVDADGFPT